MYVSLLYCGVLSSAGENKVMCCNYCLYFAKCEKRKKNSSKCCHDCAEYEFCPTALGGQASEDDDIVLQESDHDSDIFGGEEL